MLCWAIGIPGFAWLVLSEHKQQLANTNMREKFGFLYKGYKLDSFYWECLIMYRKVAMIFISVFLNGIGAMVQALVVLLLLIFFILLTLHKKPYHSRKLNDLEIVSLVTSCIAFYCGLYFLSSKSPDDPSFVTSKDCKFLSHSSLPGVLLEVVLLLCYRVGELVLLRVLALFPAGLSKAQAEREVHSLLRVPLFVLQKGSVERRPKKCEER